MIDIKTEKVVTIREACRFLPKRRAFSYTHPFTIFRWAKKGLRGTKLETIRVGGTLCTSVEALQRFFNELSATDDKSSRGGE